MFFKLTFSISSMHITRGDLPAKAHLDGGQELIFWIREVAHNGSVVRDICISIMSEFKVSDKAAKVLESLKERRISIGDPAQLKLPHMQNGEVIIDESGAVLKNWAIKLEWMPESFRQFYDKIYQDLNAMARQAINAFRWRQNVSGNHQPFSFVSFQWSSDASDWAPMPSDTRTSVWVLKGFDISASGLTQLVEIFGSGKIEPFAHELIREARSLLLSAPRSALLIAIASLETGLKAYLNDLIPNSDVLLNRMQSPPILTLIQEVIPELCKIRQRPSEYFPFNKENKDYLKKWVRQRNDVAHGKNVRLDSEKLDGFIMFSADFLYLLDYHMGCAWAREFLVTDHFKIG